MRITGHGKEIIVEPLEDPVPKRKEAIPQPGDQRELEKIAKPEREKVPA